MMRDDENPSDAAAVTRTSTPPAAKVAREITLPIVLVAVIVALTAALIVGKLSEVAFVGILTTIVGGLLGRAKPEGVVGEQALVNLMKR